MFDDKKRDRYLKLLDHKLKTSFAKVREELDEHLESINDGTAEMQNMQDNLAEVEGKIEKLNSRVDEMHLMISDLMRTDLSLDYQEQKVFLALYMNEGNNALSYSDLAHRTNVDEVTVKQLVAALMSKGVELIHEIVGSRLYFRLHPDFKELQAKEKIIEVSADVKSEMTNRNLKKFFI